MRAYLTSLLVYLLSLLQPAEEALSAIVLAHAKKAADEATAKAVLYAQTHGNDLIMAAMDKADGMVKAAQQARTAHLTALKSAVGPITADGAAALVAVATQSAVPQPLPPPLATSVSAR